MPRRWVLLYGNTGRRGSHRRRGDDVAPGPGSRAAYHYGLLLPIWGDRPPLPDRALRSGLFDRLRRVVVGVVRDGRRDDPGDRAAGEPELDAGRSLDTHLVAVDAGHGAEHAVHGLDLIARAELGLHL